MKKIRYWVSTIKYTFMDFLFVVISITFAICFAITSLYLFTNGRENLNFFLGMMILYVIISVVSIITFKLSVKENKLIIDMDYNRKKNKKLVKQVKKLAKQTKKV